jgi:predicted acetyltransferase
MNTIQPLTEQHLDELLHLIKNAYTDFNYHLPERGLSFKERIGQIIREDATVNFWGYFKDGKMVGCMRLHDYTMNLYSTKLFAGGIGLVAVDLLHKKGKIALEMVEFFLKHYKERGASFAMLYPFRPDFYKKMGFGFGTKMDLYSIKPEQFPNGPSKEHIRFLSKEDKEKLNWCYDQYTQKTNGLLDKTDFELEALFNNPENRIIGYEQNNEIQAYAVFTFKNRNPENFLENHIHIKELVYLNSQSLNQIFTFFHSQADQVARISINTQDEDFHYLFTDARNGSNNLIPFVSHEINTSGVGVMYRVLDSKRLFASLQNHKFGNLSLSIKWNIADDLLSENNQSVTTNVKDGFIEIAECDHYDIEVSLGISDFSSLITGSVNFSSLLKYGLATVSNEEFASSLNRLFNGQKPLCLSGF